MELKGKALFNLLRISWLEDESIDVKPWHVEDLRQLETPALFQRLKELGLAVDAKSFPFYAENCESPEELVTCLWIDDEDLDGQTRAYLILFELWRRLFPTRMTLSIFCDELDHLIDLYDSGELKEEEPLQNALTTLEDILDSSSDEKEKPKEVFAQISLYCAHDLERFIFDFIFDQIEEGNETYASELLDDFYDYISDKRLFDFLRARLFMSSDIQRTNLLLERLLSELVEKPDVDFLLLIAESLIHRGDIRLFMLAIRQALGNLKTEEQFQDILTMVAEYYRCLDREEEEKAVKKLLETRVARSSSQPVDHSDQALSQFAVLLKPLFQ